MRYKDLSEFRELAGYKIEGVWYPRVTKIVEIKSKPGLYQFYSAVGYHNGEKIKEKSATEGTMVHEAAEAILLGKEVEINGEIRPAIEAFKGFLDKNKIRAYPDMIEKRIRHEGHRYAGTVDAVVKIGGDLAVLDIKTSQAIYRDYNLQTAAYFEALKAEIPGLKRRFILRIDQAETCANCRATRRKKGGRERIKKAWPENGICKKEEHVWNDCQGIVELRELPENHNNDLGAFLGAKRLWEWENEIILRQIGYIK